MAYYIISMMTLPVQHPFGILNSLVKGEGFTSPFNKGGNRGFYSRRQETPSNSPLLRGREEQIPTVSSDYRKEYS